jgi:hypothetical protein
MSGIKFWKADANLRPVYKKPFYEILSGILDFLVHRKYVGIDSPVR